MFQIGDQIIYGSTGVCKVTDVTTPDIGEAKGKLYYVLAPLYQDGVIYTPVESKVFMRPIITKEEAEALIDSIPTVEAEAYHNPVLRELEAHYDSYLRTHSCEDLIRLTMSTYAKKQAMAQQNRKFGAVDERFMKRAEDLLQGELSASLGIPREQVGDYIAARVSAKRQKAGA